MKEIKKYILEWYNNEEFKKKMCDAILDTQELIMNSKFYNTFNSIERFTDDAFSCDAAEDGGYMSMTFTDDISSESQLLLDSMVLGLDEIHKQYGDEYISFTYKEV